MKSTKEEIQDAVNELQSAMFESFEADNAESEAKIRKQKAHMRLLLAKDIIRNLNFN